MKGGLQGAVVCEREMFSAASGKIPSSTPVAFTIGLRWGGCINRDYLYVCCGQRESIGPATHDARDAPQGAR